MSVLNPKLTPNTNDLQERIIQSIKHFSEIKKLEINDKFIKNKIIQISEQEIKLKNFAKDYNLKMNAHAYGLNIFADSCEGDHLNGEELLKSLRKLNDLKINENKSDLLNQIKSIKNDLTEIFNEISDYNKNMIGLTTKINKVEKDANEAFSLTKVGVMIVGIGTIVASAAAIPLTAGASLMIAFPANAIATLGASFIFQGTATATVSAAVVGATSIYRKILDHELKSVKEQISELLEKMQNGLKDINAIIPHCESHFEKQVAEIEEVEKILDFLKKFDDKHLINPIAKTISTRARKNSEGYNASDIQQALSNILREQDAK